MIESRGDRALRPDTARRRVSQPALQFFCDQILHRRVLERQIGIHPLQPGVLGLELLDSFEVRGFHPAVLRLPLVVRRLRDPVLAAQLADAHPGVRRLQDRDDLRLRES